MFFRGIRADGFPPFGDFEMRFPAVEDRNEEVAEVHLITGINGTGKTRLLVAFASALGNDDPLWSRTNSSPPDIQWTVSASGTTYGWLSLSAALENFENVPAFAYSGNAWVSDHKVKAITAIPKPVRRECLSFDRSTKDSEAFLEALIRIQIQAALDQNGGTSDSIANLIARKLNEVVSDITGTPFSFKIHTFPDTSIHVQWDKNELELNQLPDGLRAILGWFVHAVVMMNAWLENGDNPLEAKAIFLLDEVETFLHPAWQRRVLPAFQKLFPKSQMFVVSHSPFVISSLNHGWIHKLSLNDDRSVKIHDPLPASEGDSYIDVVEDIMGVPEWFDPETERLLEQFRHIREEAYEGKADADSEARELAKVIGNRSQELRYMMGRELAQMERQLTNS